jgi:hypothetical protein
MFCYILYEGFCYVSTFLVYFPCTLVVPFAFNDISITYKKKFYLVNAPIYTNMSYFSFFVPLFSFHVSCVFFYILSFPASKCVAKEA